MKKFYNNMVSILLLAGTILAACSEIEPAATNLEPGRTYTLRIHATKTSPATKSLTTQGEGRNQVVRSFWDKDDTIDVYDVNDTEHVIATLTATTQVTSEETDFTADVTSEVAEKISAAANGLLLKYKAADYDNQDGTLESMSACDFSLLTIPASKITVNNESFEINIKKADFESQQAIVQFKIENEQEPADENDHSNLVTIASLVVDYGYGSFTVNLATPSNKFFVAIPASKYVNLKATGTDGRVYTYQKGDNIYVKAVSNVLENGYYYPIAVHMHAEPMLGDAYYSDGSWACNAHANNAQVVGIVVYLGTGAITEEAAGYGHGLVMALKDAGSSLKWSTKSESCFDDKVTSTVLSLMNFGGKAKTEALATNDYPAAKAAKEYGVSVNTEKCSGWFLPSSGQWLGAIYGLCGAEYPDKTLGTWWLNGANRPWGDGKDDEHPSLTDIAKVLYPTDDNGYAHTILNAAMKAVSDDYDEIITKNGNSWISYWTSSENSSSNAIRMNFGVEDTNSKTRYSSIKTDNQKAKSVQLRVRAFLAF